MLLELNINPNINVYIDGNLITQTSVEISPGKHKIRCEQTHIIYRKYWWLLLFNPILFLQLAFFKRKLCTHNAYNSEAAVIEFDCNILFKKPKLWVYLGRHGKDMDYNSQYSVLFIDYKGLQIENFLKLPPKKSFKTKWIVIHITPPIILSFVFIFVGFFCNKHLLLPIIYVFLTIINTIFVIRNKSVL